MQLYNEDALQRLKLIEDESVDLILSDVPYKVTSRGCSGTMGGYWKEDKAKSGKIFDNNTIHCSQYMTDLYRVLKPKSHCYIMCNNTNLIEMLNEGIKVGFNFVKSLIWKKNNKICGRYYMNCFEYILLFRKGGDRPINNCGTPDILDVPIYKLKNGNGKNLHDTEKPVELAKIIVENASNEGDVVLDPFMGIGFVGIACKELNRNFIGIELDEKYFNIAKERINDTTIYEKPTLNQLLNNDQRKD